MTACGTGGMCRHPDISNIWIKAFLADRNASDVLWAAAGKEKNKDLRDAMIEGSTALLTHSLQALHKVRQYGLLLYAFDGTTVLQQGGAS